MLLSPLHIEPFLLGSTCTLYIHIYLSVHSNHRDFEQGWQGEAGSAQYSLEEESLHAGAIRGRRLRCREHRSISILAQEDQGV